MKTTTNPELTAMIEFMNQHDYEFSVTRKGITVMIKDNEGGTMREYAESMWELRLILGY